MDAIEDLGRTRLWGATVSDWGIGLAVAIGALTAILLIHRFVLRTVDARVAKQREADGVTHTWLADFVQSPLRSLSLMFFVVLALYAGSAASPFPRDVHHRLDTAMLIVSIVQAGILLQQVSNALAARWMAHHVHAGSATVATGIRFASHVVIWTVVLLLVLGNLGVELSGLIAGLGVGGVAAALAVQNILGDLFASLALYFDRPFDIGDSIQVGTDSGTVTRIGMRSTRVRGAAGNEIVFPNADLAKSRIHNFRRMEERRVTLALGLVHGTHADDIERAVSALRQVIEAQETVRLERAHFKGFSATSLDLEAVYFVLSADYGVFMDRQQTINLAILRRFEAEGLDLAFPTQSKQQSKDAAKADEPSPRAP